MIEAAIARICSWSRAERLKCPARAIFRFIQIQTKVLKARRFTLGSISAIISVGSYAAVLFAMPDIHIWYPHLA
jgi:hypothetical protein